MPQNQALEDRTVMSLDDFRDTLRRYNHRISYPCAYPGQHPIGVIIVESSYSPTPDGTIVIGQFKTLGDGERDVFDVGIRSLGPAHDIAYLEASAGLKRALETEGIPFVDERNVTKLREEASKYARRLLELSEDLQ